MCGPLSGTDGCAWACNCVCTWSHLNIWICPMSLSCVIIGAVTAEVNDSSTEELMDDRVSNVHVQKYAFLERFLRQKMRQQFFLWAPPANISFGFLHLTLNGSRKCPKPTVSPNQTLAAQSVSHVVADSSPSWMHTFARMHTQHTHTLTRVRWSFQKASGSFAL